MRVDKRARRLKLQVSPDRTGQGAGNGVTYTNTQVAGNTVSITSGADTTLKGAVVTETQVTATVGGNLSCSRRAGPIRPTRTC